MIRGVTGVVKESLDKADGWVGRFGRVGLGPAAVAGVGADEEPQRYEPAVHLPREDREISREPEREFRFRMPPPPAPGTFSSQGTTSYTSPAYRHASVPSPYAHTSPSSAYVGDAPSPASGMGRMHIGEPPVKVKIEETEGMDTS